jgi:cytidine deaminase
LHIDNLQLLEKARRARKNAYAPYSGFKVGAAALTGSGEVFTGCNVENAAYGLSICAEACAIAKAVSEGHTDLVAVAVIADTDDVCRPCGSCRQIMLEFGEGVLVIMGNLKGNCEAKAISKMLPSSFSKKNLR